MKKLSLAFAICGALTIQAFASDDKIKAKDVLPPLGIITGYTVSAPMMLVNCSYKKLIGDLKYTADKAECFIGTVGVLSLGSSLGVFKRMQEAQPEALDYLASGEVSANLESVVLSLQEEVHTQGVDLTFDEAINLISLI
ncbi:MAG: hypothetical protein AB7I27_09140 [Bacteriovoracaceae bacterium]